MKNILLVLLLVSSPLLSFSGEFSNFEIVGFSEDMSYFSFAEYGLSEETKPFANLFIVNVQQNYFVNNGVFQNTYNITPQVEENGLGAFMRILLQASSTLKQYRIDPLNRGKLIYVLLDGEPVPTTLSFTDFDTNTSYNVGIQQKTQYRNFTQPASMVQIQVEILFQGRRYAFTVGNPSNYRPNVKNYVLRSIYTSLNQRSLIFVLEKHSVSARNSNDRNIHYMVETLTWR